MAVEYKGSEFLYLVYIGDEPSGADFRLFNQTDGSTSSSADAIELDTKDKTGSDYGAVTQEISLEGILTEGDDGIEYIVKSQRKKKLVKITEVNTRTSETETGMYMLTGVEKGYSNGEYATYSVDATLNGSIKEGSLEELPEGAPEGDAGEPEE